MFFTVSGTQKTHTLHVPSIINVRNLSPLLQFPGIGASIFISPIFHVVWVNLTSAYQIHSETGPQFEFCWSTEILADLVSGLCGCHRVLLKVQIFWDVMHSETAWRWRWKHCCDPYKCWQLFTGQDGITLGKTFEPWDCSFFMVVIIGIWKAEPYNWR